MERGIIFNTEMVRAILEDYKTNTRRVIIPQPPLADWGIKKWNVSAFSVGVSGSKSNKEYKCPYGKIGDLLYVRETWAYAGDDKTFWYKASDEDLVKDIVARWKPSIHMPKSAARIWLEITDIRVERLQDITEEDAKEEGVKPRFVDNLGNVRTHPAYKFGFIQLWNSINEKRGFGWAVNPWVWVIEFKKYKK
jgi:hypothetical protein